MFTASGSSGCSCRLASTSSTWPRVEPASVYTRSVVCFCVPIVLALGLLRAGRSGRGLADSVFVAVRGRDAAGGPGARFSGVPGADAGAGRRHRAPAADWRMAGALGRAMWPRAGSIPCAGTRSGDESWALFGTIVRETPDAPGARLNLGDALQDRGQAGPAIEQYRAAIRLEPETHLTRATSSRFC